MPPMYWSTGSQARTLAGSSGRESSCGLANRRKYQEESTNVSMVSVSRRADRPHRGHAALAKLSTRASGDPPVMVMATSSGRITGSSASGTGTVPHASQ